MRGDGLGAVVRRRRWTDAEKFAVVRAVGQHDALVTQVAQRHDLWPMLFDGPHRQHDNKQYPVRRYKIARGQFARKRCFRPISSPPPRATVCPRPKPL